MYVRLRCSAPQAPAALRIIRIQPYTGEGHTFVRLNQWSSPRNEINSQEERKQSCPSELQLPPLPSAVGEKQFTESSRVHYRRRIWPKCLQTNPSDVGGARRRRGRVGLPKLTLTATVDMSHDVFYNSDPDTQGRCSVRLQLQALYESACVCACMCVWREGSEGAVEWGVGGGAKLPS